MRYVRNISVSLAFLSSSLASAPLTQMSPFVWSTIMKAPPAFPEGNQILHFKGSNKPYQENTEAVKFVKAHCQGAKIFDSDAAVLRYASDCVHISGFFLQVGLKTGAMINFMAALKPTQKIYGFDTFQGLEKPWIRKDKTFEKGTFAFKDPGASIPVLNNVIVYKGPYDDALSQFQSQILQGKQVAFLHIDTDSYEPTKEILTLLKDNIRPGTIIVFDEFYNYPGSEEHEWKAFQEFLKETGYGFHVMAYNQLHEQVAIKIKAS